MPRQLRCRNICDLWPDRNDISFEWGEHKYFQCLDCPLLNQFCNVSQGPMSLKMLSSKLWWSDCYANIHLARQFWCPELRYSKNKFPSNLSYDGKILIKMFTKTWPQGNWVLGNNHSQLKGMIKGKVSQRKFILGTTFLTIVLVTWYILNPNTCICFVTP